MKQLLKITFMIFISIATLVSLSGCKEGAAGTGDGTASPPSLDPGDPNTIQNPGNTVTDPNSGTTLQDHTGRNPQYGTVITQEECFYISQWQLGIHETWYFGQAYVTSGWNQAQVNAYNAVNTIRFDFDGVVARHWDGTRWVSRYIRNEWWQLSQNCRMFIQDSLLPIGPVYWNGVQIN